MIVMLITINISFSVSLRILSKIVRYTAAKRTARKITAV